MEPVNKKRLPVETSWVLGKEMSTLRQPYSLLTRVPGACALFLYIRAARDLVQLARNCLYDFMRVARHSSAVATGNSRAKLAALITMNYHGLEKGMSLPSPRPGFGKEQARILVSRLQRYGAVFGFDENAMVALNVLRHYCRFNEQHGALDRTLSELVETLARYLPAGSLACQAGGVKLVRRGEFLRQAKHDLTEFFSSRASVRQYADRPVELKEIEASVELARRTPSCCNRQSSRVWVITDPGKIQTALEIQGGARGFKQEVPLLLVVTSSLASFQSSGERYQSWIDGGMFAMSLIYALHSLGLATCCLNWSKDHALDKKFRREFHIPPNETIIVLISVGHPKEEFSVAQSHRRGTNELINIL